MAWFNLLYRFVRLGPLGLGGIAVAILTLGYYLQVGQNDRDALKAAALAAGRPASVAIEGFDQSRDMTALREVVVQAQPVMDLAYRLTLRKDSGDDRVFMVPLIATGSGGETDIVGIAYFPSANEAFDDITPALLMTGMVGFGDVGPLIDYNGKLSGMGQWDELTEEAFVDEGLVMPENAVIVWPYMDGREAAIAPSVAGERTIFGLLSKIAGAIGLLALAKLVFSSKPDEKNEAPEIVDVPPDLDDMPVEIPAAMSVPSAMPLWKQRSGFVDDTAIEQSHDFEPAQFEPADFDSADVDPTHEQPALRNPRKGFGVRKILIGIVGGLFILGLASAISDLVTKSSPVAVVETLSYDETLADGVADAIVSDADPNRHWTDIDIAPVTEWFVSRWFLALTGDKDAQMALAIVGGGVFGFFFMLRWFFVMRRMLRPRTTARFDSMGIN